MRVDIKRLRKEKGWTQAKTALELGISLDYVRSLESGRKSTPSLKTLTKIATVFGCGSIDETLVRESA